MGYLVGPTPIMARRRGRWVHPSTHRIVKFMPSNPPERGDTVLVDGQQCRVVKARVRWRGATWTIDGVKVRPL